MSPGMGAAIAGGVPSPAIPGYRVKGLLGRGGFSTVFEAERSHDSISAAIKVARTDQPLASAALCREEKALVAIGPPAVPQLWGRGELDDGSSYLILEYVRAPTLAERMAVALGPLPADLLSILVPAIVRVSAICHEAGYVHCDLKPENIFVGPFGSNQTPGVRLFDFGLARSIGARPQDSELEELVGDERVAGTPEYMAPEQYDCPESVDARTDVYALGVILYEMLCGAPPFWGSAADVQQAHRGRRPPPLSLRIKIASELEEVILRCLAKDPERRFQSAMDLHRALETAMRTAGPNDMPAGTGAIGVQRGPEWSATRVSNANHAGPEARERSSVALVFFEVEGPTDSVRVELASLGSQLAHAAGNQHALVFGREFGDNPTRAAVHAAQRLIHRGFCRCAFVDLSTVVIQARPDGGRRYQGAVFRQQNQYPSLEDPPGVLVSSAVAEVLPGVDVEPIPGDRPRFLLRGRDEGVDFTHVRAQANPLIGRDGVLQELLDVARWATTVAEPTLSTVIGDPGYGKSHLAAVLTQQLQSIIPRVEVMVVRPREAFGQIGDLTTQEILGRLLGRPATPPSDLGRGLLAENLGATTAREVWAGVAVAMGWAGPEHPDICGFAAAPGALRSATARAIGELLRARSRRTPLAVVIDDAHLVDDTALDALEFAALQEASCSLWICVAARPAFGLRRAGWGRRAARRQEIRLPCLSAAGALELVQRLLLPVTDVPSTVLAKLAARTEGVPLLIVELVRGLKRDGLLRKSEKTDSWFVATEALENLPALPLVEWLASSETASLPPELMAHARLVSVLGSDLSAEELEGVMRVLEREGSLDSPLDAGVGLERLVSSGLMIRVRGRRVAFRNSLLRETIYRAVPPQRREQIHRAAYGYYFAAASMAEDDRLPRMALHASRSGAGEQAASIYLELARRAQSRHAYLDAELLYAGAVDNLPTVADARHVEAFRGRGLMRFRLGRLEDGLKDLSGARRRACAAGDRVREVELLLDESMVLDWLNDFGQSAILTAEAVGTYGRDVAPSQRSPLLDARIGFAEGRTLHRQDREADAAIFFADSVRLAEGVGPDGYETMTQARNLLAWAYAMTGRYDESDRTFDRNIAVCESTGDMFNLTVALQNRGILSMLLKRLDRMLADYRRMISIARENGFGLAEIVAQKDIGEVHLMAGDLVAAEREARQAIDVSRRTLGERSRATMSAELFLARVLLFQGRPEAARELSDGIRMRQQQARADGLTESDFGPAEGLMHRMVDIACAAGASRGGSMGDGSWTALLSEARAMTQQPQDTVEMLEVWGLTALRVGAVEEATQKLAEAIDLAGRSAEAVVPRVRAHLALAEAQLHQR